ncbi:hypothetical protein CBR_g40497 [Chara braunii]|uniref:Importin N-terminal domain-containing protein n=1 Tax=Chara braunii TaxID=69332 RepID=A0A388LTX4_CHABU|nr:hypothetical protein CBR_g40497 [Chara braunii]|eukprot:GBG85770.1 hypothetical protein CBR_g40497 [Chara braunii]
MDLSRTGLGSVRTGLCSQRAVWGLQLHPSGVRSALGSGGCLGHVVDIVARLKTQNSLPEIEESGRSHWHVLLKKAVQQRSRKPIDRLSTLDASTSRVVRSALYIIASPQIDISVRQVASICFKNLIAQKWGDSEEGSGGVLLPQDKAMIRDHILEAVTFAPPIIRSQLGECLKSIILNDYPSEWENLLPLIDGNLKSQDTQRIHGALFALRILARKFEFKDDEERVPIQKIIETTFPVILPIFTYLLSLQDSSVEIADLMKLICKIFWSSTYLEIPKYLQDSTNFMAWMTCLHTLIERPVPTEGQPVDPELRKTWAWWKLKKWTLHIIDRLFTRFGDPKCAKKCDKVFATMFQKHCAGKFLESHLSLLSCLRQGGYLPERVINFALKYLATSVGKAATYQLLKPHLDIILYEIVFPLLCFNDEDEALWRNDPHEYVRKGYDIIEDLYGARTAAINFLSELMRKRGKDNLQRFLNFIVDVFRRCQELPLDQKPYRQKDGALLAIGALSDILKKTDPYKGALETMLVQHVLPEFQSPLGHLRAKAAWVCGQYGMIKFADSRNFTAAMHCVVNGLRDPELPVRVDSVVALREFVIACQDLNELRPILPNLLDEFFKLMNEVENDDLVYTLERIVDKFGEEIAPYALGLCQNLGSAFWKCLKTSEAGDDDEDMGALAAVGCLQAISAILESIGSLPHLFPQLEPTLLPILKKMLTTDGEEVYEEVLQILTYLTYITPTISQGLWDLWPLLMEAMDEWAVDNFEYIINPIDNYISRGTEVFLTCKEPNYPQSLFKMITQVLENENLRDNDCIPAPKLLEAVLQNCKGRVDEWVEPYVQLAVTRLRRTEKPLMKDLLIQVGWPSLSVRKRFWNLELAPLLHVLGQLKRIGKVSFY